MMTNKIFIVIPAYNEEKKIGEVVSDLKNAGYNNIVVVDDGSADNTFSVAEKAGAIVLRHMINRGQGAGIKTGISYALQEGADIIITFDADGQHDANDLKALIDPVAKGEVDIALGSRFLDTRTKVPFIRRLLLKGGALIFRILYGIKLTDSHNGLRAFSRKAAETIEINSDRMEHASEIPEQIAKKKLKYKEIPVHIKYTDYSKLKGQTNLAALRIFFRMLLNKFLR